MPTSRLTPKRIDALLRFLPDFERPGRAFVEHWNGGERTADGAVTVPYPVYCADVVRFFRLAGEPWWNDYDYDPEMAGRMIEDDDLIRGASLEQIKAMLTYCVRGERFADGHWEAMLSQGRVPAVLRRLRELRTDPRVPPP